MSIKTKTALLGITLLVALGLVGCAPEVGSEAWCQQMKEKPKGDWSANEAADFAKHCVFN
ncbi:MAG: DUF3012 domain-containing protein [Sedimenticola sp.]|nr:DUF3012 domain-containing protein [Sedimenticola sp.]